jgi:radical SAM superfamily enzyme YgiQ (UPF0313 family)
MSGVRAHNEELTKLGLTLPGFVDRNRIIASMPSLGLLTLAGLTPDKFAVEYREIADLNTAGALPEDYDLVAISSFSAQMSEGYKVGDFYRDRGIPVVLGGLHVTSLPEEALEHATSVVVGEGEPRPLVVALLRDDAVRSLERDGPVEHIAEAPSRDVATVTGKCRRPRIPAVHPR